MARQWRWWVVLAGVAVLAAIPPAVGALPARDRPVSAADLLAAVKAAGDAGYSGYAEAVGGLQLPLSRRFSELTDIFGGRTRLRIWRQNEFHWRVDAIEATGERDLYRDVSGVWTWDYDDNRATRTDDAPVRLPRTADLDPVQLGRRLLSEARAAEVSRLPAQRVAGVLASGLRLTPDDPDSTVGRVDVWAEPRTGLPLRVEVYGKGSARPILQTAFLDVDLHPPAAAKTGFAPPAGALISIQDFGDPATDISRYAPFRAPRTLAGYPIRDLVTGAGAVGSYGRGVTILVAVPLLGGVSGSIHRALSRAPGVHRTKAGDPLLTVGPLSLLLTDRVPDQPSWLLAGTVTPRTLERAARELAANPPETQ